MHGWFRQPYNSKRNAAGIEMEGFSLLWVYNIKNRRMSHKDDYNSTLDLSARTGIKVKEKQQSVLIYLESVLPFLAWSCREVMGVTVTLPPHISGHSAAAWVSASKLTEPTGDTSPGLHVGARVTASLSYFPAQPCVWFCFVLCFCSVLL